MQPRTFTTSPRSKSRAMRGSEGSQARPSICPLLSQKIRLRYGLLDWVVRSCRARTRKKLSNSFPSSKEAKSDIKMSFILGEDYRKQRIGRQCEEQGPVARFRGCAGVSSAAADETPDGSSYC